MLLNSALELLQHVLLIPRYHLEQFVKRQPQFANSTQLVMDLIQFVLPIKSKPTEQLVMTEMNVLKLTSVLVESVLDLVFVLVVMDFYKQQLENNAIWELKMDLVLVVHPLARFNHPDLSAVLPLVDAILMKFATVLLLFVQPISSGILHWIFSTLPT